MSLLQDLLSALRKDIGSAKDTASTIVRPIVQANPLIGLLDRIRNQNYQPPLQETTQNIIKPIVSTVQNVEQGIGNYFAPTNQVRVRDVVREAVPYLVPSVAGVINPNLGKNLVNNARQSAQDYASNIAITTPGSQAQRDYITSLRAQGKTDAEIKKDLTERLTRTAFTFAGEMSPVGKGTLGNLPKDTLKKSVGELQQEFEASQRSVAQQAFAKLKAEDVKTSVPVANQVQQTFRGDKLNLPPEQLDKVTQRLNDLGLTTRGVRTFGDVENAAQTLGTSPDKLLQSIQTNRITDKEVVALRNLINTQTQFVAQASKDLPGLETANPSAASELGTKITFAQRQIDDALGKLIKGGTESGRAVSAYRILANQTTDPIVWQTQAKRVLGDRPLTPDMINLINDFSSKNDVIGLSNFVALLRKPSLAEKGITFWKAMLLSNPTTHIANLSGNVGMAALENIKDIPATGIDILSSLVTGKRTKALSLGGLKQEATGFGITGPQKAVDYLKQGYNPEELLGKYDIPRQTNFDNKLVDTATKSIFRALGAEDQLFRQPAYRASLYEQALVAGKNQGLKGSDLKEFTDLLFKSPTAEMVKNASEAASYRTFQEPNAISSAISRFSPTPTAGETGPVSTLKYLATEVAAPFRRTPSNIASTVADYSPIGVVKSIVQAINPATRNQKAFAEELGRGITGTSLATIGSYLALKGRITGASPSSQAERDKWQAEGKQPYSIKVGNKWVQYNRAAPIGNILSLGADFINATQNAKSVSDVVTKTVASAVKDIVNLSPLKGAQGILDAIANPDRANSFTKQLAGSVIPSLIAHIAYGTDTTARRADTPLQKIESRIPGVSKTLLPQRNIYGEPVKYENNLLGAIFNPFIVSSDKSDSFLKELDRLDKSVGKPSEKAFGYDLTPEQYDAYLQAMGPVSKSVLNKLVQSEAYKKLPQGEQEKLIDRAVDRIRETVKGQLFKELNLTSQLKSRLKDKGLDSVAAEELAQKIVTDKTGYTFYNKKAGLLDQATQLLQKLGK